MKYLFKLLIVLFIITACGPIPPIPVMTQRATGTVNPTTVPDRTVTQTPILSLTSTNNIIVDIPTQTPRPFWTPSEPSLTQVPTPVARLALPDGSINMVIIGSDNRPSALGIRTDTLIYVSFNPSTETVTMISFPRDLYVYMPGWRVGRINTAWQRGGEEMLRQTMLYNFGLDFSQFVLVDFTGFVNIINGVEGIDVEVGNSFVDECRGEDRSYLEGQTYHLDGDEALCYVRMRKTTSDFHRKVRQAEVLISLFKKIGSLTGFKNIPELYKQYKQSVETDITLSQALRYAPTAVKFLIQDWRIKTISVTNDTITYWTTPDKQAVLVPIEGAIQKLLEEALTK